MTMSYCRMSSLPPELTGLLSTIRQNLFALKCARKPSAPLFAACVGAPLAAVFTKLSAVGGLLASLWLFRVRRGWRWALTYG